MEDRGNVHLITPSSRVSIIKFSPALSLDTRSPGCACYAALHDMYNYCMYVSLITKSRSVRKYHMFILDCNKFVLFSQKVCIEVIFY